jgi:hypothetical protein
MPASLRNAQSKASRKYLENPEENWGVYAECTAASLRFNMKAQSPKPSEESRIQRKLKVSCSIEFGRGSHL